MPRPVRLFPLAAVMVTCVYAACPSLTRAQDAQILGFTDINYLTTERDVRAGFYEGQMVGHLAAGLAERISFHAEVSASARPDGYRLEVERTILRYDVSDVLKVSAGRYHTPLSYWNVAYHHGLWLQTSVARPEMIRFGSRFMPVHFVGLLVEGAFPGSALGLGYYAGVGNGRDVQIERASDAGDPNDHRAWMAGLSLRPARVYGLQVGAAIYRDRIEPAAAAGAAVPEWIMSGHVVWEKETPEVLAEVAHVLHEGAAGTAASTGGYVQLGYRLPGAARAFKPYARLERIDIDGDDPVFAPLGLGYRAAVAGVRYDFTLLAALKAEYRAERFEDDRAYSSLYLQASFTFPSIMPGH